MVQIFSNLPALGDTRHVNMGTMTEDILIASELFRTAERPIRSRNTLHWPIRS